MVQAADIRDKNTNNHLTDLRNIATSKYLDLSLNFVKTAVFLRLSY